MVTVNSIKYDLKGATVELGTGETLRLDPGLISEFRLSSGCEMDNLQYRLVKDESEKFEAFERALRYLSIRIRTEKEVTRYLSGRGFSEFASAAAIAKLYEYGYINDREFAEKFISYQRNRRPVGRRYLEHELFKKGVSRNIIQKAVKMSVTAEDEVDSAASAARKKFASIVKKKNPSAAIYSFLAQRGFDSEAIGRALNLLKSEGYDLD